MSSAPLASRSAARMAPSALLRALDTTESGLTSAEAARRLAGHGPNAILSHHARPWRVLGRQFRSPLLLLLAATAVASYVVGERSSAAIIGVILAASIGLGFLNEYRAERAAEELHDRMRRSAPVLRDGAVAPVDVVELVPGDVVELRLGHVVPADVRLLEVHGLECIESALTGESAPVPKATGMPVADAGVADLDDCAWMGTVVSAGSGRGVVVATGADTEFGRIASGLGSREPETPFQAGLRHFSMMLVEVAAVLVAVILGLNLALGRPLLDALLFSLAIAVGISPQLLPAVVSTSLAAGTRRLAARKVLVKRLVAIEDLGNVELLFTDKTGTLTEGRVEFMRAVDPAGAPCPGALVLGMACTEARAGVESMTDALDAALWSAPNAPALAAGAYLRQDTLPFDHDRRLVSVLVDAPAGERLLVTKGAPEAVLSRCRSVPAATEAVLGREFEAGHRVIAVASRGAGGLVDLTPDEERGLDLVGFLVLSDPPKASAAESLGRLAALGITVKVISGDNAQVAATVCAELGLDGGSVLTGDEIDRLEDPDLATRLTATTVFARVDPAQKARIVRLARRAGTDVGFLGDGVNDALALHAADVGIAVDSGADVAKDAADVVLLEKNLDVLADGVVEGRRIFANTIKYVLMGTSSNFGNMVSAAVASGLLPFLPMLPSQILLNNLLYDASQLAIPTDRVDEEQLARPTHWDIGRIRRFMLAFGPISSIFDFVTFWAMLHVFHADEATFHSGWFVESLATQTLVLFVIRTRRVPFTRSKPSASLLLACMVALGLGVMLPASPIAHLLGFRALPFGFFAALTAMAVVYLALAQLVNALFFREPGPAPVRPGHDRTARRAAAFSVSGMRHPKSRESRADRTFSPTRGAAPGIDRRQGVPSRGRAHHAQEGRGPGVELRRDDRRPPGQARAGWRRGRDRGLGR